MASNIEGSNRNIDEDDMMKILVATDNHIGYMEKDPVRHNDSLEAFEEILKIAKSEDVDFILLGGDLFHENKPSRQTLHCTMELLRYYCVGNRPCSVEFRSDPTKNFYHSKFPVVNYEDPNYNISIPIFSIHGNHDDPVGEKNLSAMDILHVSNLINYFGKVDNIEEIEISPVLLQKGQTKLAIYGLGSCRDERLNRMFQKGKVKFLRPSEEETQWFNVFVLHQNRAKHGASNYIPPSFIPDFFDLVVWGHEHECRLEPEFEPTGTQEEDGEDKGLYITQPGSSIATSLSEGEQMAKNCGILYIKNDCTFKLEPVKLKTVRPFIMNSVCLMDTKINPHDNDKVESYLTEKVMEMINEAKRGSNNDKLPLVRLKVDYHGGYNTFSLARFGQKFLEEVANPKNILLWHTQRDKKPKKSKNASSTNGSAEESDPVLGGGGIAQYLQEEVAKEKIGLLSDKNMIEALFEFVDKMENDSVSTCVKYSLQVSQNHLKAQKVGENNIEDHIDKQRDAMLRVQETEGMSAVREELASSRAAREDFDPTQDGNSSDSDNGLTATATKQSRGRGRGRGSRGGARGTTKSRGGGRGGKKGAGITAVSQATPTLDFASSPHKTSANKRSVAYLDDDDDDDDDDLPFQFKKKKKVDQIDIANEEFSSRKPPLQSSRRKK